MRVESRIKGIIVGIIKGRIKGRIVGIIGYRIKGKIVGIIEYRIKGRMVGINEVESVIELKHHIWVPHYGSHILCCLLYTLHLCTNMDPKCASTSTKSGMSCSVDICNRIGLQHSHAARYVPQIY